MLRYYRETDAALQVAQTARLHQLSPRAVPVKERSKGAFGDQCICAAPARLTSFSGYSIGLARSGGARNGARLSWRFLVPAHRGLRYILLGPIRPLHHVLHGNQGDAYDAAYP